jgi:type III secretory pathway component EscV
MTEEPQHMLKQQSSDDLPAINVLLQIDASLGHILDVAEPLHGAVLNDVQQKLDDIVGVLGVPGVVALDIGPLPAKERADFQWMSLRVNGILCRYPEEVLLFAWSYAAGRRPYLGSAEVQSRIREARSAQAEDEWSPVAAFFGLACAEIVSRQPAVLLAAAHAAVYSARLEGLLTSDEQPNPSLLNTDWLLPILKRLLELRLSISDTKKVASVLADSSEEQWEDVAENLVDTLAPHVVELRVPETYVSLLTTQPEGSSDLLTYVRETMFDELGIVFPPLRPVPMVGLKPNSFQFLINHLPTLPVLGLGTGECLVNATTENVRQREIEGQEAVNPVTEQPATVVDVGKKELLEEMGFTAWNQADYCLLVLAETLRRNCACFVHPFLIESQLEQLGRAFPALVEAARAKASVKKVTRVLRALVSEEVSIRDLWSILERLLDYQYRASDPERYLLLDDRLSISSYLQCRRRDDLVSFVRAGLKRQISNKFTRGTSTLGVYLLDPELEKLFNDPNIDTTLDEERQEYIITALANELSNLPPTVQRPSILTAIDIRIGIRDAIKLTFPRIGVLSYEELWPGLNIQPVARISLR